MNDEDFKQTVLDYFQIATQRNVITMAALADVKSGQDAILAEIETLVKENREALGALKDTGAAGHSAVLDDIMAGNQKIHDAIKNASGELKSTIATTPMPGQTPGPQ
jgi:hypothetical protein